MKAKFKTGDILARSLDYVAIGYKAIYKITAVEHYRCNRRVEDDGAIIQYRFRTWSWFGNEWLGNDGTNFFFEGSLLSKSVVPINRLSLLVLLGIG